MLEGRSKMIAAGVIAVVGIAAAAWSLSSLQRRPAPRPGPEARQPAPRPAPADSPGDAGRQSEGLLEGERRVVHGDGPGTPVDPVPQGPFEFVKVASDAEFRAFGDALESAVEEGVRSFSWIDANRGDHRSAAGAARLALAAPARGKDAFLAAATELRGDTKGGIGEIELISTLFEGVRPDLRHLKVKEAAAPKDGPGAPRPSGAQPGERPRAAMMMRVERSGDGPEEDETTLGVPVAALFPKTADEIQDGQKTIEVKCPARIPGMDVDDGRAEIGVVLVRERSTGAWQPIMYNIYARDRDAAGAKAKAARAAMEGK